MNLIAHTEREYSRRQYLAACDTIKAWAAANPWDAVVWTALPPKFLERFGQPFSLKTAQAHLNTLPGEARQRALHYIHHAPPEVVTPLRHLIPPPPPQP